MRADTSSERITFSGGLGHELSARLERPLEGEPTHYALFAHCFTCTKDFKSGVWISRALARRGIAVLRFDFTGLGQSGGDFADTNFTSNVGDIVAAADYLRDHYAPPALLVGHSLGGTASLVAAEEIPEARALAVIASASDTDHLRQIIGREAPDVAASGRGDFQVGGQTYEIKRQLLEDLGRQQVLEHVAHLNRALLVLHSEGDQIVPMAHGERIFSAATHPKAFITLEGSDHLLIANRETGPWAGDLIATWARPYLGRHPRPVRDSNSGSTQRLRSKAFRKRRGSL
jgi:pimeloyl-ACP methyl ester carboxylesterase